MGNRNILVSENIRTNVYVLVTSLCRLVDVDDGYAFLHNLNNNNIEINSPNIIYILIFLMDIYSVYNNPLKLQYLTERVRRRRIIFKLGSCQFFNGLCLI